MTSILKVLRTDTQQPAVVSQGYIDGEKSRNLNMADRGCGHSPTGELAGWQNTFEEEQQQKLKQHQEKEAKNNNDANE